MALNWIRAIIDTTKGKEEVEKMVQYRIGTTIQRIDGTFDYCVEKATDFYNGLPFGWVEIFRGTLEECEKKFDELLKECV